MPPPSPEQSAERRSRLLGVKLAALVAEHRGQVDEVSTDAPFPPGAALAIDREAWVLLDETPGRRLGSALAWALRRGAECLHVVADADVELLSRRASAFSFPIRVWQATGRSLEIVEPSPAPMPAAPPAAHLELRELIAAGGATPVVEHGVVSGEVRGLEVCRVVDDPDQPGLGRLDVGVGVHDREAFRMLHGDTPTVESLARVVDAVRSHRRDGAPRHPFNRMSAERYVRWRIEDEPALVGLRQAEATQPPVARTSAVDPVPCVAVGVDHDGARVLAVCSSGVDLDLVPYAADARSAAEAAGPSVDRLVLVTPERDQVKVTLELAGLLSRPVELLSLV